MLLDCVTCYPRMDIYPYLFNGATVLVLEIFVGDVNIDK